MGSFVWLVVGALLLAPTSLMAQTADSLAGRRVVQIQYSPAEQPLDPVDMERAQMVKVGEPLDLNAVAETIDRLYASGRYEDIQVEGETAPGGVIVHFITQLRWFVSHVGAGGKVPPPPNRGQLTVGTQLTLGQPFDSSQLAQAEDNITRLFTQNGLYEAQVAPQVRRDPHAQQVSISFVVRPGDRAKYEQPIIQGNTILSDETIVGATGWRRRIIHWWRDVTQSRTTSGLNGILRDTRRTAGSRRKCRLRKWTTTRLPSA